MLQIGDRICPYCNNWSSYCTCNAGTAKHGPFTLAHAPVDLPQLTADELAEVRSILARIRERGKAEPGWLDRVFGTAERFDSEAKASHYLSETG